MESEIAKDLGIPKIGMVFQDEEEAYNFYNDYGRSMGFSVRRDSVTKRANNIISRRVFCCSNQGSKHKHSRGSPLKPRSDKRTECKACMIIKIQVNGQYSVMEFVEIHNHDLAPQSQVHILRSQRKIQDSQAGLIKSINDAGFGASEIFSYFRTQSGGSQNTNFLQLDLENHLKRRNNEFLEKVDAQLLADYFKQKQKEDPNFFYSVQMDEYSRMCSCFWCDGKSKVDYGFFGDVITFDTTYRTNGYDKPFAPFVGVNHHGQSVLFGGALLMDETTESFVWLFETFLDAMNGKPPQTIFTDQAMSMANAIKIVFPTTHHRLCLWHIFQNAAKHLSSEFEKFTSFAVDFKHCIYDNETEEEFHDCWDVMLGKYGLRENEWLKNLYKLKEKWAQVYGREHFCAGMTTTQRSEGMNSYFKKYFKCTLPLRKFIVQYQKAVTKRRDQEVIEDFRSKQFKPIKKTNWTGEAKAAEKYSRKIFDMFQDEYMKCLTLFEELVEEDRNVLTYKVVSFGSIRPRTVTFDYLENIVKCSCKNFEFTGILCAHALKILLRRQVYDIPSQYYLNRWTKDAKAGVGFEDNVGSRQVLRDITLSERYSELAHIALTLAVKGANTLRSSAFAKHILTQCLKELDDFQKTTDLDPLAPIDTCVDNKKMGENDSTGDSSENIRVYDPPRKQKKGKRSNRVMGALDKATKKKKSQQKRKVCESMPNTENTLVHCNQGSSFQPPPHMEMQMPFAHEHQHHEQGFIELLAQQSLIQGVPKP